MKILLVVFLLLGGCAFAENFSIYPLTPEEFSSQLELPLEFERYVPEPYSMQYVYPDEARLYSMRFVEPDPNTEFSMYTPESTAMVPEFELELPEP
jgi:hypothetical protein